MDPTNEEVLFSESSTAGAIRKLILNINAARKSLVEWAYKRVIIDVAKTTVTVETMDGEEKIIPASSKDNDDLGEKRDQFDKIGGRFDFI
jgi:hypothetical protein